MKCKYRLFSALYWGKFKLELRPEFNEFQKSASHLKLFILNNGNLKFLQHFFFYFTILHLPVLPPLPKDGGSRWSSTGAEGQSSNGTKAWQQGVNLTHARQLFSTKLAWDEWLTQYHAVNTIKEVFNCPLLAFSIQTWMLLFHNYNYSTTTAFSAAAYVFCYMLIGIPRNWIKCLCKNS